MSAPTPRPEPVLTAAKLAGNVSSVVTGLAGIFAVMAIYWHWAVAPAAALAAVGTFLSNRLPVITAVGARAQVTPLEAPQAMDGTPLVAAEKVFGADVSPLMGPDAPVSAA